MVKLKELLRRIRIIPVLRIGEQELAHKAAEWLLEAGLGAVEVTMSLPEAPALIKQLGNQYPEALIGAGTVLNVEDARAVIEAGARFVVTPCLVPEVADACKKAGVSLLAGAATPREVMLARQAGSEVVKIFPAKTVGGPGFIKTLKAVFPDIELMPTGGVRPADVPAYLDAGALCVGLGSELLPMVPLREGNKAEFLTTVQQSLAETGW